MSNTKRKTIFDSSMTATEFMKKAQTVEYYRGKTDALYCLQEGKAAHPNDVKLRYKLIALYNKLNQRNNASHEERAVKQLKQVTYYSEILKERVTAVTCSHHATRLSQQGYSSRSINLLKEALENFTDDVVLKNQLGHTLSKAGKHNLAITVLKQTMREHPDDAHTKESLKHVKYVANVARVQSQSALPNLKK